MTVALTVTFDLEDNRRLLAQDARFAPMSYRFLDFIEERGISATVFVVGNLASTHGDLVRRVAEGGHEIALHGLRHVALGEVGPARLRVGSVRVASCSSRSGRGPCLASALRYSRLLQLRSGPWSRSPKPGSPTPRAFFLRPIPCTDGRVPHVPCRWENGMLELPCPVGGAGRLQIPFLGGIYLRYVPRG